MDQLAYEALEPVFPLSRDSDFVAWVTQLAELPPLEVSIRRGTASPRDARRLTDLQVRCAPITVRSVRANGATLAEHFVLLAEIEDVHVGYCCFAVGAQPSTPIIIQVVAVAPEAQRRGIGLKLLTAASETDSRRDIVLATQDNNIAARALNARFAASISAVLRRIPLSTYPDHALGIQRGHGYRAWTIERV
ncbi:GNAT family N-acetyltransferase [Microbacterium sp. OR16]|uniref:GNAT family N-acetyltransferase n=1 Tax=Microbacterium sp. OR16 TaxID=3095345 RepID=UPI0039B46AA5